jgi:ribosomal-protein-serine acetyltransferase
MTINIDEKLRLELTAEKHTKALYDAVDNNREHLSEFLPWVDNIQSIDDFHSYIKNCELLYQQGKEVSFVIILDEVPVGRIGLHHLNIQNKNAAIGYWLTKNAEGKGIISRSCKVIITYAFQELGLHRIEIKAAVDNLRSQAIPKKFNFTKEGILRQAELVNNKFLDLVLYSMISNEWMEKTTNG